MKLWLLQAKTPDGGPWDGRYDMYYGFVIRAETEADARRECPCGDEGDVWRNAEHTSCTELLADGETGIVLSDFLAG